MPELGAQSAGTLGGAEGGDVAKVTGIGGAFLRANDPKALYEWYEKHLGLTLQSGCFMFEASEQRGPVVVSFFKRASDYFPVSQPAMLNFQVDDLDATARCPDRRRSRCRSQEADGRTTAASAGSPIRKGIAWSCGSRREELGVGCRV